ncbi:MAG TPA: TOMM precursor leader peptide-binding protein [Longimicrobium sp.]|jgi:ribosomal protein S12 methylthiotransferase accessory factor
MTTTSFPTFNPALAIEILEPDGLAVLSDDSELFLSGNLYCRLALHIDGRTPPEGLVERLAPDFSAAEVYYGLQVLQTSGLVLDSPPPGPAASAAFWHALGANARSVTESLEHGAVAVSTCGAADATGLVEQLAGVGLAVRDDAPLKIVVTDDYLRPELAACNARAMAQQRPWILARLSGAALWLGPLFAPASVTGCWSCLATRLRYHRVAERQVQRRRGGDDPVTTPPAFLSTTQTAGAALLAQEAARWLGTGESALTGAVVSLSLKTLQTKRHTLARRPQCEDCGVPLDRSPPLYKRSDPLVELDNRAATIMDGTGVRVTSPDQTFAKYAHHVSPITGVVAMLVREPAMGAASPIHLHTAVFAEPHLYDADRWDAPGVAAGKGTTDEQARASALCEAIERHCGSARGEEPVRRARIADLGGHALHPGDLLRFSTAQYDGLLQYNRTYPDPRCRVMMPFKDEWRIDWTPGWSLTNGALRWLPAAFCWYGHRDADVDVFCRADSNGNASGNTLDEAVLHGLLELVERDASAVWWLNRVRRPGLDLDSLHEPYVDRLRAFYGSLGRDLWALDLTSDLGIPAFAAVSARRGEGSDEIIYGFGAHLNPRVAVLRAFTECNQCHAILQALASAPDGGGGDGWGSRLERAKRQWLAAARLRDHLYLLPDERVPRRPLHGFADLSTGELARDVAECRRRVENAGIEVIVVNQTRPDVGMPVVKVVAPGLCHPWRRLGASRLYEVPVVAGWRDTRIAEDALNPAPKLF